MIKVSKDVGGFLGARIVLEKNNGTEQELDMLADLLKKVIVECSTLTLYDLGGNEIEIIQR